MNYENEYVENSKTTTLSGQRQGGKIAHYISQML